VTVVDGAPVGAGTPGPLTTQGALNDAGVAFATGRGGS
jgi:hypothetical protein